MRFLSLFAGIGGIDLGLERAGMTCVGQVEIHPYCRRVLAKHWPNVWQYDDVRTLTGDVIREHCGVIDLVAGGFPCQPVSVAGRKKAQDDARWLWPEFHRIVCEVRPAWALLENVTGLLDRGIGDVLGDLAACGYDAEWDCVPAAAFGAPHLRDRVFVVAYPGRRVIADANGRTVGRRRNEPQRNTKGRAVTGRVLPTVPDTTGAGLQREVAAGRVWGRGLLAERRGWEPEPDVDRVAHGIPDRVDRTKALGNAVLPQAAEWIGLRMMEAANAA